MFVNGQRALQTCANDPDDHSSVLICFNTSRAQGTLQDSFLCMVFRCFQKFNFVRVPMATSLGLFWSLWSLWSLRSPCSQPRSTNTSSSVATTRTWLEMLEHDSEFLKMNRVYHCCKTYHQRRAIVFYGFSMFSMFFPCCLWMMALQFLLLRFGSSRL